MAVLHQGRAGNSPPPTTKAAATEPSLQARNSSPVTANASPNIRMRGQMTDMHDHVRAV